MGASRDQADPRLGQALVQDRRCSCCAERVPARLLLTGGACPHCGGPVLEWARLDAGAVADLAVARWRRWRVPSWAAAGTVLGVVGFVPLLPGLLLPLLLVAVHLVFIRRPLRWLPPGRRIAARVTLQLLLAGLAAVNLVVTTLVFPLMGLNALAAALLGVGASFVYVEAALSLVRDRLHREARRERLAPSEWALPALAAGGLLLATGLLGAGLGLLIHLLVDVPIPGVGDLAIFLSGW